MRDESSKWSCIYRLYFDDENLSDITRRRRIWHLPTCNQGQVIIRIREKQLTGRGRKKGCLSKWVVIQIQRRVSPHTLTRGQLAARSCSSS